jgi:hypothetical protein
MTTENGSPRLAVWLLGALSVWAVACFFVHGAAILAYIGLQILTAGVFAWQMTSVEKSMHRKAAEKKAKSEDRAAA